MNIDCYTLVVKDEDVHILIFVFLLLIYSHNSWKAYSEAQLDEK